MSTTRFLIAFLFLLGAGLHAQIVQRSHVVSGGAVNAAGGSYTMRGTVGQPVIGITGTTTQAKQGFWYTVGTGSALSQVQMDVTVFLQGPYSAGTMSTALKTGGYLPTAQPYNVAPWSYGGTETSTLPSNMVDWVLVELRSSASVVYARDAGILLSDGKIKDEAGNPLVITGVAPGSYYVVIRHRNHLAVMSSSMVDCSTGTCTWNFTDAQTKAYGSPNGMKDLGGGKFGMFAGDADANGQVQNVDKNTHWAPYNGTAGYKAPNGSSPDFDLNGQVQNTDKNLMWGPNNGLGTQVPSATGG